MNLRRGTLLKGKAAYSLYQLLKLLLITVFLSSGLTKALDVELFAETVAAYGLLPDFLILPVAISLVMAEIIAAIGLFLEKSGALPLVTLMMLIFIAVLSYGIVLGLDIDCGCFGPTDAEAEAFHDLRGALRRDLLLTLAIGYLYLWRFANRLRPHPWLGFVTFRALSKEA